MMRFISGGTFRVSLFGLTISAMTGLALAQTPQPRPAQPGAQAPRPAQPAAAPAGGGIKVPLKPAPEQPDWLKVCGEDPAIKKTVCFTQRQFVAENNQPVMAVAVYAVKDDTRRFARFLVPLTFMIQPGIRFSTEGLSPVNGRFQICAPQGCFVEADLNDAVIGSMKKGTVLRIDMQNQVGQEVNFELPLDGFGKTYDSAGIDQATLDKMEREAAAQQQSGAQPSADDLKRRGEELLRQRQQPPRQ
jgi:invasion protein IalB